LSFRGRLTLSYTILTAALLTVALSALAAIVVERTIRSTMADVDAVAARVNRVVQLSWLQSDDQIAAIVAEQMAGAPAHVARALRKPHPFAEEARTRCGPRDGRKMRDAWPRVKGDIPLTHERRERIEAHMNALPLFQAARHGATPTRRRKTAGAKVDSAEASTRLL